MLVSANCVVINRMSRFIDTVLVNYSVKHVNKFVLMNQAEFELDSVAVELKFFIFYYEIFKHTNFGKFLDFFGIFSR